MLFLLVSGLISHAQDKGAKIEFKAYTIDYGTINKGADGIRTFKFTNTGDEPLIIKCQIIIMGVLSQKLEKPILPGENGEIELNMILTE